MPTAVSKTLSLLTRRYCRSSPFYHTESLPLFSFSLSLAVPRSLPITITVVNEAPVNGTCGTPVWIGIHDGNFDTYNGDEPLPGFMESLVEDGDTLLFWKHLLLRTEPFGMEVLVMHPFVRETKQRSTLNLKRLRERSCMSVMRP